MAISYVNTVDVLNISKEILTLTEELDKEIDSLFTRFSEVPTVTGEWVGQTSQFYFDKIANDKKKFKKFISEIRDVGYKLSKDSSEIQACITKCIKNED